MSESEDAVGGVMTFAIARSAGAQRLTVNDRITGFLADGLESLLGRQRDAG